VTVCAGIILYNPNIERLTENVNAILSQVSEVVFVDNASNNLEEIRLHFTDRRFHWIINDTNIGISGALNQLINFASDNSYQWILTLDQDSVCESHLVSELEKYIHTDEKLAMVSPRIVDRTDLHLANHESYDAETEDVTLCITSGCLTNVMAVIEVGLFDERLFIDSVDHEMCLRLRRARYRIIRVNNAKLLQEFGQSTIKRKFLWKTVVFDFYPPIRVYYQTRNNLFLLRKYKKEYDPHPLYCKFHMIAIFAIRQLYEPQKIKRTLAFFRGYISGLTMKI